MDRRVRQHHADSPVSRRDRGRDDCMPGRCRAGDPAARSVAVDRSAAARRHRRGLHSSRAVSTSATITANGLSSRCLRVRRCSGSRRRRRVGAEVVAAQALDRDDCSVVQQLDGARRPDPRRSLAGRVDQAQTRPARRTAGRLRVEPAVAGSVYSAAHVVAHGEAGHGRGRPVVRDIARDRVARTAVRAVDERVSDSRRLSGSRSSARQSSQVALSAVTEARRSPAASDATIRNPSPQSGATSVTSNASIVASGGVWDRSPARKSSSAEEPPSTSMRTPVASLPTKPVKPRSTASRCTNGRKPTPWTMPST